MPSRIALAAAFARSWLSYRTGGPRRPISAAYCVTNRCNLRCEYCRIPLLGNDELDLAGVTTVLERLWRIGVRRMGLSGGEPLVRTDIDRIIASARDLGFYVTLNTNLGLYSDRREVFDSVDLVLTSLDGDRGSHEAGRGSGSFDGVLDAITDLVARGVPVVAICVLTHHNSDQLDWLLDTADEVGFRVHLQSKAVDALLVRGPRADLSDESQREIWRKALEYKRRGRPIASSVGFLETLAGWEDYGTMVVHDPGVRCAAGAGFLYVDAMGLAYPCAALKGRARPVDLLTEDWQTAALDELPCTRCIAGALPEFNLMYQRPVGAARSALQSYV